MSMRTRQTSGVDLEVHPINKKNSTDVVWFLQRNAHHVDICAFGISTAQFGGRHHHAAVGAHSTGGLGAFVFVFVKCVFVVHMKFARACQWTRLKRFL